MAYTDWLSRHPEEVLEVLKLTGLPDYTVLVLDDDEQVRQADQILREQEQLDREIDESGVYDSPRPYVGIDFKKAAQECHAKEIAPAHDGALTPEQADLVQKGKAMYLPFGKFGPRGVKGYKTIYEIWLEEPTYLAWVHDNVDRLTPLQDMVIGFYRQYKSNATQSRNYVGSVPFPGTAGRC